MFSSRTLDASGAERRLAELRSELEEINARLVESGEKLGTATADADEASAGALRRKIARDDARRREIDAAIPVLERRIGDAERAAADRAAAERKRVHEAAIARRKKAAAKVDDALVALEAAFVEYADLSGLEVEYARNQANAQRSTCMSAASHFAPKFWVAVAGRFIDPQHRRPLGESAR